MKFKDLKRDLRRKESENYVQPLSISKTNINSNEIWCFELDKLVLYKDDRNNDQDYMFKAKQPLDYHLHAHVIDGVLRKNFPNVEFEVTVTPKFKTLPIPLLEIPIKIPFFNIGWRKSANKLRYDDSLATIPTTVTIKTKNNLDSIQSNDLWNVLNRVASLHTENSPSTIPHGINGNEQQEAGSSSHQPVEIISISTSKRASKNLFRWILNGIGRVLSYCMPEPIIHHCVPLFIKQASRPYPYGYVNANTVVDTTFVNSGAVATAVNAGSYAALCTLLTLTAAEMDSSSERAPVLRLPDGDYNRKLTQMPMRGSTSELRNHYGAGLLFNKGTITPRASHNMASETHAPLATRVILKVGGGLA